jgi:hypothetical protein
MIHLIQLGKLRSSQRIAFRMVAGFYGWFFESCLDRILIDLGEYFGKYDWLKPRQELKDRLGRQRDTLRLAKPTRLLRPDLVSRGCLPNQ